MRYELVNLPADLPVGKHPTRVGNYYRDDSGEMVLPIEYAPEKRVEDSAMPLIQHAQDCSDHASCRCGWVHHDSVLPPAAGRDRDEATDV